jgi:Transposase/Transposase DDE domain
MRIIGCDLHARQQTLAMLDTTTGEVREVTLQHEGDNVREFYSSLPGPVRVGIEATGSMQWFVNLMEELGIERLVGHPAQIRAAEPRKQKHDRRDADLILKLLVENRFPAIWLPSKELQDLRSLLRHRHPWVRLRTRIQNALQSIALANGLRRGTNRNGLIVDSRVWEATGTAERYAALEMLQELPGSKRMTVAGDKGFDRADFVRECRNLWVTPHVAQNLGRRGGSAIDSRTARHAGYAISQKKRKRIEECFGWLKTIALLRKVRHRGTLKVDWIFTFACAAYNLVRMRNLMHSVVPT